MSESRVKVDAIMNSDEPSTSDRPGGNLEASSQHPCTYGVSSSSARSSSTGEACKTSPYFVEDPVYDEAEGDATGCLKVPPDSSTYRPCTYGVSSSSARSSSTGEACKTSPYFVEDTVYDEAEGDATGCLKVPPDSSTYWPRTQVNSSLSSDIPCSVDDRTEEIYETYLDIAGAAASDLIYDDAYRNTPVYLEVLPDTSNICSDVLKQYSSAQIDSSRHQPAQAYLYGTETPPPGHEEEEVIYESLSSIGDSEEEGKSNAFQHAINELIKTEESYVQSLQFVTSDLKDSLNQIPGIDVKTLFSNLMEIGSVSIAFLDELKMTKKDEQNQFTNIAKIFQIFSQDMQEVYSVYCSEYPRALSLLDHYKETNIFHQIQEVLHSKLSASKCFDISFYLVMPVQRITKYPLLIQKIVENIPSNQESRAMLQRAFDTMQEVNHNINDYKRRKEVAGKYLRIDQRSLMDRVSLINTHTLTKKTQRLSQMFKQQAGIVPKREDKEFDCLAEKFQVLLTTVNQLKENVACYVKNLEVFLSIEPHTSHQEYPQGPAQQFQHLFQTLYQDIYPEFKRRLQFLVLEPLSRLSECLKGPKNLIRKRMDKLLDYENLENKYAETGKATWEEEDIIKTYKTFHSMLLSELPLCIILSMKWLHKLLITFLVLQREMAQQAHHAADVEAAQLPNYMVSQSDFRKWIKDCIWRSVSQLSEFTKKFDEEMPEPTVQEHSPIFRMLLQRHGPDKIYQVTTNVSGSRDLDLTLHRGQVVALLQISDTKGNKTRWLVDTGATRGYVPSSKLKAYHLALNPTPSSSLLNVKDSMEKRRHSYTPQACPYPVLQDNTPIFQVVAGYAFNARSSYEVSVKEGQPVTVLEPHDKKGSPEWSLVEVNGQRGYMPSNYLVKVPVPISRRQTLPSNYT